jgi:hypothetical protein
VELINLALMVGVLGVGIGTLIVSIKQLRELRDILGAMDVLFDEAFGCDCEECDCPNDCHPIED